MCANFDVQLWNWFLVMNSYSTLQVCMKFAYIVTGLVFLLSYWISDNVPREELYWQHRNASRIPTGIPKSSRLRLLVSGNFKIISTLYSVTKPSDEISYYTTPSHLLYQNGDTMSSLHINGLLLISESEF